MTISKLYNKCEKCSYKDNCDNKRMMASREHTPITINMGGYGNIETSIEAINEQIKKDFYKKLSCNFNSFL